MSPTTLKIRINQAGNDSAMWYAGKLGEKFTVQLGSCAQLMDNDKIASGWVHLTVLETKNAIELTHADIIEQIPIYAIRKAV